jgi:hypothetical protein
VFLSLCYVVVQSVLQLAALRFHSNESKELEIVLLRHELAILRRRTCHPPMTWTDRLFLAAASRLLPAPAGGPSLSHRRRCLPGIGAWWRSVGRTRVHLVARRSVVRSENWSCASRETIRGGAIHASLAS